MSSSPWARASSDVRLPDPIVAALEARPAVGDWSVIVPLLTVDENGFPHVCLLSSRELMAAPDHVLAVVSSPGTIGNLRRDGRAALWVLEGDNSYWAKLTVRRFDEGDLPKLGVVFVVSSVKSDGLGIPLRPSQFLVTADLAEIEDWNASRRILHRLTVEK